jgi:ATP-binding cassette, subfamily B, bacterial HlyB/CyaB
MAAEAPPQPDSGLQGLAGIAAYFRIPADPAHLARELALGERPAEAADIVRAAGLLALKARIVRDASAKRLAAIPTPALARTRAGGFLVLGGLTPDGLFRTVDPVTRADRQRPVEEVAAELAPAIILVQRRVGGPGLDPQGFSIAWFAPSIWRYRGALAHGVLASLAIQLFALATPLFFQVVIDKVLVHRSASTLYVLVAGLVLINLFDTALQFLRTYALTHTTNRIDVELGQRLFAHLLRLPVSYFETRPAGQTVARMRELETIRSFLTGQALTSALDLLFAVVFIAVLFLYSARLALIVVATIPLYVLVAALVGPGLRERIKEKFNRGALSQQLLVETVVGAQTVKAAAVEPAMRAEWE